MTTDHAPADAADALARLEALARWAEAQGHEAAAYNLREIAGELAPCDD